MSDEPWEYGDMNEEEEWPEAATWCPARAMLWAVIIEAALVGAWVLLRAVGA